MRKKFTAKVQRQTVKPPGARNEVKNKVRAVGGSWCFRQPRGSKQGVEWMYQDPGRGPRTVAGQAAGADAPASSWEAPCLVPLWRCCPGSRKAAWAVRESNQRNQHLGLVTKECGVQVYSTSTLCAHLHCPEIGKPFPGGSAVKISSIIEETKVPSLGRGRSPEEGNGNPLQYPCLENPVDRGAGGVTVHRVTKELDMTQWLNNNKS